MERGRCDHDIAKIEGLTLLAVGALKQASQFSDRPSHGQQVHAAQKDLDGGFLKGPETCVNFSDINWAACQRIALRPEVTEHLQAPFFIIDGVNGDAGVEEKCCHVSGRLLS